MEIIKFIKKFGIDALCRNYGISSNYHESLPLVLLRYEFLLKVGEHDTTECSALPSDKLISHKTDTIIRECRSLILDTRDMSVVVRPFYRFFNWFEGDLHEPLAKERDQFDFDNMTVYSKEDGTYIALFHFMGQWIASSRSTYGGKNKFISINYMDEICDILGVKSIDDLNLSKDLVYSLELCTNWNVVITQYDDRHVFLLTVSDRDGNELSDAHCDIIAADRKMSRPKRWYDLKSIDDVNSLCQIISDKKPDFEGVIIRDKNNYRWKIKTKSYYERHLFANNGRGFHPNRLIPLILDDGGEEIQNIFPQTRHIIEKIKKSFHHHVTELRHQWNANKHIVDRKDFYCHISKSIYRSYLMDIFSSSKKDENIFGEALKQRRSQTVKLIKQDLVNYS